MKEKSREAILALIESSRDAVVCSVDDNGCPNAKAMFRIKNEGIRTFWFSTNVSALRTGHWRSRPQACVYFADGKTITGLMLTGAMEVCMDDETKRKFWKPGDRMYYPLGPTDPDYCMLRFTAEQGSYYKFGNRELFAADEF